MRISVIISPVLLLAAAGSLGAQTKGPPVEIAGVRVGFRSYLVQPGENPGQFKVGLWTPVAVKLHAGPQGLPKSELVVESPDSDNMNTRFTLPVPPLEKNEKRTVLAYIKPGTGEGRFVIGLYAGDRAVIAPVTVSFAPLDLRGRIYLALGGRVEGLQETLVEMAPRGEGAEARDINDSWPRFAAFETELDNLPTLAVGYDLVDLMFLTSRDTKFLEGLLRERDAARLKAIAQWVGQGGRLVVSIDWNRQALLSRLLSHPAAWQPPLPVVPPEDQPNLAAQGLPRLKAVEEWATITGKPFVPMKKKKGGVNPDAILLALLQPVASHRPQWKIMVKTEDGRPIIAQMPYGRGNITLLAFDLAQPPFTSWPGRVPFLKYLIARLEPRLTLDRAAQFVTGPDQSLDLTTQMQTTLDKFDVPVIPFGWVALFILVYILIVGPLDYFLLKNVFKRLEWTWITFPSVVLLVSIIAYFTAYAVKGEELKINKVDLIDFDLRTDLDQDFQPQSAHAYGTTWFTILSPQIKSYTIGLEPAVAEWWGGKAGKNAQVLSWLGRPEFDGPGAMARPRLQGFSNRFYSYRLDDQDGMGIAGVPIPVWTSKSFTATWDVSLGENRGPGRKKNLPLQADLRYFVDRDVILSGTIQSHFPMDLEDVWLLYQERFYHLGNTLSGGKDSKAHKIVLGENRNKKEIRDWLKEDPNRKVTREGAVYNPTLLVKTIMFHELADGGQGQRNHSQHRLDLSWRLRKYEPLPVSNFLHDAILYARLPDDSAATYLWLDDLPGPGKQRPRLPGTMTQDTYIRIILPVKPGNQ